MTPLRVLYLEAGSGSGGSSASLKQLIVSLTAQGIEPYILASQRGSFLQQLEAGGVPIEVVSCRGPARGVWMNLLAIHGPLFRAVRRAIRRARPQVLHLNNSPRVALAAIAAAKLSSVPVISHLRVTRPLDHVELSALRWIDRLIVTSETARRICLGQGVRPEQVVCVPNGLDIDAFRNGFSRSAARAQLGFSERERVIGVVSRLLPPKGHDVFLRALRRVADRHPDVRAVIVGDVCEGFSDYPQRLRALAAQLGLGEQVRFTGWISHAAAIYPAFDLVAQTSLLPEGFSLTCLEAMAYGIPVISTKVGATSEVVEDGVTGCLVPPNDPDAMAGAILELLADPARRRRMGQAGYERAVERFDIRTTAAAIEAVYRAVVK